METPESVAPARKTCNLRKSALIGEKTGGVARQCPAAAMRDMPPKICVNLRNLRIKTFTLSPENVGTHWRRRWRLLKASRLRVRHAICANLRNLRIKTFALSHENVGTHWRRRWGLLKAPPQTRFWRPNSALDNNRRTHLLLLAAQKPAQERRYNESKHATEPQPLFQTRKGTLKSRPFQALIPEWTTNDRIGHQAGRK